jgi:hypothetical protein
VAGPLYLCTMMKSILDRSFRYVPSHATDVRKTFERIRREREMAQPAPAVVPIKREKKSA